METWIKRVFLGLTVRQCVCVLLFAMHLPVSLADDNKPLIAPDVKPQPVDESLIDTENFELGVLAGYISIEDFESSFLYGARAAYHLTERFFLEANIGFAEAGETSFEKLAGNVQLISDEDRDYRFYNVSFGYNILPGEAFMQGLFSGDTYAFNTNFYLVAGAGATDFAGDNRFTANFGAGYQLLMTDWLSLHLIYRQHMYDIDVLGETKTSQNTEFSTALTVFF